MGLSAAYGAAALRTRDPLLRALLLVGVGAQGLAVLPLQAQPDWVEAAVLVAAAAVTAGIAVWSRAPAWLLLAALQFAAAWYWLAKLSLPPPAHPSADTLLVVYSPLPLAYGLLGLALRARWGRSWAWPLYAAGARVRSIYPVIPVPDRHALAIGVLTYNGKANFTAYADPSVLPQAKRLPMMLEDGARELELVAA